MIRQEARFIQQSSPSGLEQNKLTVRCFGTFDLFWQGNPVVFSRNKTKELMAYLVDRRGAACSAEEIIQALWEDADSGQRQKTYLRVLTADLKNSLSKLGFQDILIRLHQQWALKTEQLDCDNYRLLDGDREAEQAFQGHYMVQYSWAEETAAKLYFSKGLLME